MKCPKCGSEIKDDHLYCDSCGEEIRIVPDFDLSLDEDIQANLASVVNEINSESQSVQKTKEIGLTKELTEVKKAEINNEVNKEINENKQEPVGIDKTGKIKILMLVGILLLIGVIISSVIVVLLNKFNKASSYDYQYEQAFELFQSEDYEASVKKLKKVISSYPDEDRPKLLLCDNYYELGKYDEALAVLEQLMTTYPNDMNIYERLVKNYQGKGDLQAINKLISETDDESVKYLYGDYLTPSISCAPESGIFTDIQYVVLSMNMEGKIYYTLDGSEPDDKAILYTEPIEMTSGETVIKAICINSMGIMSNVIENQYIIEEHVVIEMPKLITEPGSYTEPGVIEVEVPIGETCYYTIDNADPTSESIKYEGPIPMYIGTHSFRFACIDENNESSEVVKGEYTLDVVNFVDMGTAVNNLKLLLATYGNVTDDFEYKCQQAAIINGSTYYIINEYTKQDFDSDSLEDEQTTVLDRKPGNIYAVDVLTGLTFKASLRTDSGTYTLSAF